jgi:uncharacterized protein involved in exopolysaccharide biosynthesis
MKNYYDKGRNDETDLKEFFSIFWFGKVVIITFGFLFFSFASLYLQNAERKYTVEYNLKPVTENNKNTSLAGLGGLASFAGVQLPSSSSNDFKMFKELITSVEVSDVVFQNKELIKNIYKDEWNASLNNYSEPPKSKISTLVVNIKMIITGNNHLSYMPPNARRLAIFIAKNFQINENKETGFVNIKAETSKPHILLSLIVEATRASDKIMRERYVKFSIEPLTFYKEKLRTARSREHRESLAELIGAEEQKLMFASRGEYFVAEPYIKPTISLHPTAPKPILVLALSLVLGLFLGAALVLMRHVIKKEN